jgi:hypothetical protein
MKLIPVSAFLTVLFAGIGIAGSFDEATVTRVVRTVEIIPQGGAPTSANIGEVVRGGSDIRTGKDSRAQLTFPDQTLARLGQNTLFSFQRGTRALDLEGGAILLQVPKDAGGATIRSAPVTAAITGTTVMMAYIMGDPGLVKLIVLEGTVRMSLTGKLGESVLVGPGQMVSIASDAQSLPDPFTVDVEKLLKTSRLVLDGELEAMGLILETVDLQKEMVREGQLIDGPRNVGAIPPNSVNTAAGVLNTQGTLRDTAGPPPGPGSPPPVPSPPSQNLPVAPLPGPGPPPPP